jgi:hypothetical protein
MCVHFCVGSPILPVGELGNIFLVIFPSSVFQVCCPILFRHVTAFVSFMNTPISSKSSEMTKFSLSVFNPQFFKVVRLQYLTFTQRYIVLFEFLFRYLRVAVYRKSSLSLALVPPIPLE